MMYDMIILQGEDGDQLEVRITEEQLDVFACHFKSLQSHIVLETVEGRIVGISNLQECTWGAKPVEEDE